MSNYNLKLCPVHNTMTNHLNGVCQKGGCKIAQAEQTVEIIERWQGGDVQYSFDGGPWLTKEQVLNRQALATALQLIGEPEPGMQSKVTKTPIGLQIDEWGDIASGFRNELRKELRQAFTDYYGGTE